MMVDTDPSPVSKMGLSENVGYIPNEIAIFHRDNDQQNHWVQWGTQHFQTHPHVKQTFIKSRVEHAQKKTTQSNEQ